MIDSNSILMLFQNVLHEHIKCHGINEKEIRKGIQNMAYVYSPRPCHLTLNVVDVANYNDVAHRCAYLHKYAALHTAMVQDMMFRILEQQWKLFKKLISSQDFRICSLGGGPGNDIIGIVAALNTLFCTFKVSVTVVDLMEQWKYTFSSLITELGNGNYGMLRTNVAENFLTWNYIGANLLDRMTDPVKTAVSQASLITLVKFVSAAACQDTERMIKRIFRNMKPGGLLLFIDNGGGGFHGLIQRAANKYQCDTVFGPLRHYSYGDERLKTEKFGYTSCFVTTVTVHLLQKPFNQQSSNFYDDLSNSFNQESVSNVSVSGNPRPVAKSKSNKLTYCTTSSRSGKNATLSQTSYSCGLVNEVSVSKHSNEQNTNIKTRSEMSVSDKKNKSCSDLTSNKNLRTSQSTNSGVINTNNCNPVSSTQQCSANISGSKTPTAKLVNAQKFYIPPSLAATHKSPGVSQNINSSAISINKNNTASSNLQYTTNIPRSAVATAKLVKEQKTDTYSNLKTAHKNPSSFQNTDLLSCVNNASSSVNPNKKDSTISTGIESTSTPANKNKVNPNSNLSSNKNSISCERANLLARNDNTVPVTSDQQNASNRSSHISKPHSEEKRIPPYAPLISKKPSGRSKTDIRLDSSTSNNKSSLSHNSNMPVRVTTPSSSQTISNLKSKTDTQLDSSTSNNKPSLFHGSNMPVRVNTPSLSQNINNLNAFVNITNTKLAKDNNLPARSKRITSTDITPESDCYQRERLNAHTSAFVPTGGDRTGLIPQSQTNTLPEEEDNTNACCLCCVIS